MSSQPHNSAEGAVLYAKGPIATVHYNTKGYSPDDMSMILPGFIVALISGLLMALGCSAAVAPGKSFAEHGAAGHPLLGGIRGLAAISASRSSTISAGGF